MGEQGIGVAIVTPNTYPPSVLHKRHIASALFNRDTSIRQSSFALEDDRHPGFGPYCKEEKTFMIELGDGGNLIFIAFRITVDRMIETEYINLVTKEKEA